MRTSRWRRVPVWLAIVLVAAACNHPIEIVGEGDVLSASGQHDCTLEDHTAGSTNCTENTITGAYDETYTATPRPGWHFHRWVNYCQDALDNTCTFAATAEQVAPFEGLTWPPLTAIFRPDVNTGYESLFIGHSFFVPFANGMDFHAENAGFTDHAQSVVFSGGATGAPEALWNNASKRAEIQGHLDDGDIELFGMTYHPNFPSLTGYTNWIDYALAANPDTRIFVAMPWLPNPASYDVATYSAIWTVAEQNLGFPLIDDLRELYPGVDIYLVPYGHAAMDLRELFAAGQLPDVDSLVSTTGEAIFRDSFGHADEILVELGRLVWLSAIYDVDLSTYDYDPGYTTDLLAMAETIMDEFNPAYQAP